MIDNLFNAALALTLLVGSALALGSQLQDRSPAARTAQVQLNAQAHRVAAVQTEAVRNPLR